MARDHRRPQQDRLIDYLEKSTRHVLVELKDAVKKAEWVSQGDGEFRTFVSKENVRLVSRMLKIAVKQGFIQSPYSFSEFNGALVLHDIDMVSMGIRLPQEKPGPIPSNRSKAERLSGRSNPRNKDDDIYR